MDAYLHLLLTVDKQSCEHLLLLVDTHALVHFNDEYTSSIVPLKHLEKQEDLFAGEGCCVIWSDKKMSWNINLFR